MDESSMMNMGWIGRHGRVGLVVVVLALMDVAGASAQIVGRPWVPMYRFGAGYVVNAPRMMAGGGLYGITPILGGLGLYVDVKAGVDSPRKKSNFNASLTAQQVDNQFGDMFFTGKSTWQSFNAALIRPVTAELMLYLGGGWARHTDYALYYDRQQVRGLDGYYWVEDPQTSGGQANVMGGLILRLGANVNAMFGGETAPKGFTVGLFLTFPGAPG
jgi:hypothetical protein